MVVSIAVGSKATTCGLAGRGMNGLTGHVVCFNESFGRYMLELDSGEMLNLRPGNLCDGDEIPVSSSLPAAPATAAPCAQAKDSEASSPMLGHKAWIISGVLLAIALAYSRVSSAQTGMTQMANSTKPAYEPLGTFKDTDEARALRFGPHAQGYDAEACAAACPAYKYFALQANGFCSCENDLLSVAQYGREVCGPLGGVLCNYVYQRADSPPPVPAPDEHDYYREYGWRVWHYPHWRLRYWWPARGYDPDLYYGYGYGYGWGYGWGYSWGWGLASSLCFVGVCGVLVWQLGGGAEASKKRAYKRGWSLSNLWMRIERMNIWELFMYASLLERAVAILRRQFR